MFKSIFSKYFTVVAVAILSSYLAFCVMQMFFATRYWMTEKKDSLFESASTIAEYTALNTREIYENNYGLPWDFVPLIRLVSSSGYNLSAVLITDNAGKIILSTEEQFVGKTIPTEIMAQVKQQAIPGSEEGFFATGGLGGLYDTPQYAAAMPVVKDGRTIGYVFTSASTSAMARFIANNLQVFLLAAIGVLALTFIAVYVMTYRLVRPLRQMAAATRRFSEGDFSSRIEVLGNDEVAALAMALNNMAVSLSSLEQMRRSFIANVSHELKTPMTTIAGFIDGILDGTIPEEKHAHYLKIVSDEVKRLSRLVRTMLDLSRIDSGQLSLNPVRFDLTELACNVLVSFEQRLESKNLSVTGLEDCPRMEVDGDYDMMGQVLYNLIDNAIKFTNEGGNIHFRIEKRQNRTYFAIQNTGAGIPASEMHRIFERFYKSDQSRGLDKNGVGLGLYIVQTVINLHGGEIRVRSAEGEYTEFEFWLPTA